MKNPMKTLYDRLKGHGFDKKFVKSAILPDWWEDSLAENPANMAIAEHAIARHFGFKISQLCDSKGSLDFPPTADFRFKCLKNTKTSETLAALIVAQRAGKLVADHPVDFHAFSSMKSAQEIRHSILKDNPLINLQTLVTYCWSHGIPVLHILPDRFPRLSRKFQGVCMYCGQSPVIVLASGKPSPPWLAFDLAHELGHIMLAHVAADSPLVDLRINSRKGSDEQDEQANVFATELLTGQERMEFKPEYGLTAPKLASAAKDYGQQNAIDPGTVALIYGRSANRWPVAQNALKFLGEDTGAHEVLSQALEQHVAADDMSESTTRLLSSLAVLGPGFNA